MSFSVQAIKKYMEFKGYPIKQGTIENYRSKLQEAGILENNQPLSNEFVDVLLEIVKEKTDDNTWEYLMKKHICEDLHEYIKVDFQWSETIVLRNLVNFIKSETYEVIYFYPSPGHENWEILCNCIDAFVELGKKHYIYKGSSGTDCNAITYKVKTPNNSWYYIIGKLNRHTGDEDVHIFYNPLPFFEIMQCKYIMGGPCRDEKFVELLKECRRCCVEEYDEKPESNKDGNKPNMLTLRSTTRQ